MSVVIEAIFFDMGGTLRRTSMRAAQEKKQILLQILDLLGSSAETDLFGRMLARRARAYKKWSETTLVELNEQQLWTKWMLPDWPAEKINPIAIQLNHLWRETQGRRAIFPESGEVILELFRRGYRLGLVSNTTSSIDVPQVLNNLGVTGCFETIILSCEVGKRKPGSSILLDATNRMGIRPDRCAYIGDRPERDVAAARAAGFSKAVIHRNHQKLNKLLADPGLTPDHVINNLKELLEIFPSRRGSKPVSKGLRYDAAISSMWGIKKFPTLEDFFISAPRMGFAGIELNHMVRPAMLDGMDLSRYPIRSIHEPCPAVISAETLKKEDLIISSLDEERRSVGMKSIQHSIDLASELGVSYLVVHCGMIQTDVSLEDRLVHLLEAGKGGTCEYLEIMMEMKETRNRLVGPNLEAVQKSLRELLEYAGRSGVHLGLENRYHFFDIPSQDEMDLLLGMADPGRIGFIYDTGHAQAMSVLGFYPQKAWLERFSNRIIGTHLHDVIGIHDHLAPGLGQVDFRQVAKYLPDEAFRTVEVQPHNSFEQVKNGLKNLVDTGCVRLL